MTQVTVTTLRKMKQTGDKIACLTAYDASFAHHATVAGTEVLLVGDSLGMVVQGAESTLPVTMDEMIYHTRCVRRGSADALVVGDLPFMSYNNPDHALISAGRLMKEGGAHVVKLEGGAAQVATVQRLSQFGVPVCAHLGLLPQSVFKMGGYRVQGRDEDGHNAILRDARAMDEAGAELLVLECVPADLAAQVSAAVSMPVIGIGAGAGCDGQVLVLYDMLGITPGKAPSFCRNFMDGAQSVPEAIAGYVAAVKSGEFPAAEHSF